jgi:chromosome segregation ATPase
MKLKPLLLALACTTIALSHAAAQTPAKPAPARPAAKPAAPAAAPERTSQLGGGSGASSSKPILTREELRACLSQEATIRTKLSEHEASRATLDQARDGLRTDREALSADRAKMDELRTRVADLKTRIEAHGAKVAKWNEASQEFAKRPPNDRGIERDRKVLNAEREELQKAQAEIDAMRQALTADNERIVAEYNAKAQRIEAAVNDWNERNKAWNETGLQLEDERQGWVRACADRRYREDDEIAIKAGR